MPWVKITDKLHESDKIVETSGDGVKLWLLALSWSNDKLTDGHIPLSRPVRLMEMRKPKDVVAELVSRRLWHQAAHPCSSCLAQRKAKGVTEAVPTSGYLIHHYFDFQRPAWVIKEERQTRSDGGRKGAEARWGNGSTHSSKDGSLDGSADGSTHSSMHGSADAPLSHRSADAPVPPYPVPPSSGAIAPVPGDDDPFPEDQKGADRLRDRGRREGVRHVGRAADAVVAAARGRAAS